MDKQKKIVISCFILSILVITSIFADQREDNIDLFVVLDKSLSMEEEIEPVKNYVADTLIEETLIPGDRFVVIQFYGNAEILIAENVVDDGKKVNFKNTIQKIKADGSFTDIGNALDALQSALDTYQDEDKREYLLLITDGKQEAPEDSKYYSPDGTFNHAFLENAKTIQKEGWKIQVLGIGTASAAKELAEQLSGGYIETSEEPTQEEITEKTEDLFGTIELASKPVVSPLGKKGSSTLTLPLTIAGFSKEQTITFKEIVLDFESTDLETVRIAEGSTFTLPPEGETSIKVPFTVEQDIEPGTYDGTLAFTFEGLTVLTPSQTTVSLDVKGFFGQNIWIIPVIAVVFLAIVGVLVLLFMKMGKQKPCQFRLYIDKRPAQSSPISLSEGNSIYIEKDGASYKTAAEKNDKTVGKITYTETKLVLKSTDRERFMLPDHLPESVLDEKVTVKAKSGLKKELYFKAV